ncbi:MAG: NAD/NADP octopine/nopaline dehydrogenase family protein [Phycisphaerales bacterium]|nr:NAD/NADP octopine/nopaline dehydrogenase family protein [Phycisphaerales bacterium]
MKVTIIGSGHGGCAMAAVLAMHGHDVNILKLSDAIHEENFEKLRSRKTIRLTGIEGCGEFPLCTVSNDPSEVIPGAELLLVYYVANYHAKVAERCAAYFTDEQMIVLNPGYCGSLLFLREMRAQGNDASPLLSEFETLPYSSRLGSNGSVDIVSRNIRHPFATFPAGRSSELVARLEPVLGECVPRRHILEVSLHNPNLVIHTVGMLLNAAMVESERWRFSMYRDGFPAPVWNVAMQLDHEKMDVLEKLGAPRIPYVDEFRLRTFEDTSIDDFVGFKHYASEAPDGPFTLEHRYITEDVPMGLGLLHSLGRATGVSTPLCDSLIHLASALLPRHDFWSEARTIEAIWDSTLQDLLDALTA